MREIRALVWKEWHETRLFLWIAWGLFIGLPIIGGIEGQAMYAHRFEFWASPWIMFCGPLLAIVVGVAATCRDLQTKLEDFWQSRPMGSLRLFAIKYFVGLGVVLLACGVPLIVELYCSYDTSQAKVALSLSFLWMAVFATAFASGCFFHKTAHAAAVAVVGMLLIYFLPVVFPPFARFNVGQLFELSDQDYSKLGDLWHGPLPMFAVGMLAIAAVMGAIGLIGVRFRLHVESKKPLIYGAASAAFLILLESASYQLGTNLPVLSSVDLPPGRQISNFEPIEISGASGNVITQSWIGNPPYTPYQPRVDDWQYFSQAFAFSEGRLTLGSEHVRSRDNPYRRPDIVAARSKQNPKIIYRVDDDDPEENGISIETLTVLSDATGTPTTQGSPIELWRGPTSSTAFGYLHVWHDRLYVVGERTITFDISDPMHPKVLSDEPIKWTTRYSVVADEQPTIYLPATPGMPAAERLRFAIAVYDRAGDFGSFDGSTWYRMVEQGTQQSSRPPVLEEARLKSLTDDSAHFELVGKYNPTLVQELFGGNAQRWNSLKMKNGLLYAVQYNLVSIFDLTGPKPLRLIAHFAAPGLSEIEPLDDGRAIAAGQKLWLLGPPRR